MFWSACRVKFGGAGLCPKWYVRVMGWGEESGDGLPDHRAGNDACEGTGAGGDGGDEKEKLKVNSLQFKVRPGGQQRRAGRTVTRRSQR